MTLLFDVGVPGGSVGIGLVIGAFFVLVAVAYVIFRLLRKTLKMAFRLALVAAILIIGLVGTVAFFYLGTGNSGKPRPAPSRQR